MDTTIYEHGLLGEKLVGRVDEQGSVYKHGLLGEKLIGRIDEQGSVYKHELFGEKLVGHVDAQSFLGRGGSALRLVLEEERSGPPPSAMP